MSNTRAWISVNQSLRGQWNLGLNPVAKVTTPIHHKTTRISLRYIYAILTCEFRLSLPAYFFRDFLHAPAVFRVSSLIFSRMCSGIRTGSKFALVASIAWSKTTTRFSWLWEESRRMTTARSHANCLTAKAKRRRLPDYEYSVSIQSTEYCWIGLQRCCFGGLKIEAFSIGFRWQKLFFFKDAVLCVWCQW